MAEDIKKIDKKKLLELIEKQIKSPTRFITNQLLFLF
jgi:hypothetical protein